MKTIFTITLPAKNIRNPYALDAKTRKSGKIKSRLEKRKNNPNKQNWQES